MTAAIGVPVFFLTLWAAALRRRAAEAADFRSLIEGLIQRRETAVPAAVAAETASAALRPAGDRARLGPWGRAWALRGARRGLS